MSRPTIRDVAREAGVGLGTVSRVLSRNPHVATSTRERVTATIERLGYRPNALARALSSGRAPTIDVIVPLLTRYYYFEVLHGILAVVADTDYSLNVRVLERPVDREAAFAEVDRPGQSSGLLVLRVRPTGPLVTRLTCDRLPAVLVDSTHPDLPSVGVDHGAAMAAMVAHLLSLGHERVALVDRGEDPFDQSVLTSRRQGYRDALGNAGIRHRPKYEQPTDWSAEGAAAALDVLLALPNPPSAIVAGSDTQAIGILDRARRRGLEVPGDLSVCGYGDIELARFLGLTTVRVPMRKIGERAVKMLLAAIERPKSESEDVLLPVEVAVRTTCGAPGGVSKVPG